MNLKNCIWTIFLRLTGCGSFKFFSFFEKYILFLHLVHFGIELFNLLRYQNKARPSLALKIDCSVYSLFLELPSHLIPSCLGEAEPLSSCSYLVNSSIISESYTLLDLRGSGSCVSNVWFNYIVVIEISAMKWKIFSLIVLISKKSVIFNWNGLGVPSLVNSHEITVWFKLPLVLVNFGKHLVCGRWLIYSCKLSTRMA